MIFRAFVLTSILLLTSCGDTVLPTAPTVTSVTPSAGPIAGGQSVTIAGTGVGAATKIVFGNAEATDIAMVNANAVTCKTPANANGAVAVTVTVNALNGSKAAAYTYEGAPTLVAISPAVGALSGDTLITLTGTKFLSLLSVTADGAPCTTLQISSATSATCRTPAHAAGAVDIAITNATGVNTLAGSFTYVAAPTIASATPATGDVAGGTSVVITGSNFRTGATANIGAACASTTYNSPTQVTCVTAPGAAGAVNVTVTNHPDEQSATFTNGFTYTP